MIRINNGLSSDGMIVYALLPPVITGGICLLYHRDGFSRWLRGVVVAGTVILLFWGVVEKNRTLSVAEKHDVTSTNNYNSHRFIFPEDDLPKQIMEHMRENTLCNSAPLFIRSVVMKDDQKPEIEQSLNWLIDYMRMYATLNGWQILPVVKHQQVKESYELFYLPMKEAEEDSVNKLYFRRMIKAFPHQKETAQTTWFLATYPYNFPFDNPHPHYRNQMTLAVLIKYFDPGAQCMVGRLSN